MVPDRHPDDWYWRSTEENINALLDSPFLYSTLYEGDKDNVIGVIHVKNLLRACVNTVLIT